MAINKTIGRNRNTTDFADSNSVQLNSSTAVTIQAANADRIAFHVNNDSSTFGFWVRYYPAAQDNTKQGFWVSGKNGLRNWHEMIADNIYTGEISAIAIGDNPTAYTVEY